MRSGTATTTGGDVAKGIRSWGRRFPAAREIQPAAAWIRASSHVVQFQIQKGGRGRGQRSAGQPGSRTSERSATCWFRPWSNAPVRGPTPGGDGARQHAPGRATYLAAVLPTRRRTAVLARSPVGRANERRRARQKHRPGRESLWSVCFCVRVRHHVGVFGLWTDE